jgi:uncharacterized protein (TIGR04255 family)
MGTPRPLRQPPITEALIDFRIASDPAIDAARLEPLRAALERDYPTVEERREVRAEIRIEPGGIRPSAQDLGLNGLFFKRADGRRIAQFRRDGFTLNQLAPYTNADDLITEAMRLWPMYREAARPSAITRVAFRYINSLSLPYRPEDDFNRFLAAPPPVPPAVPQLVSTFLTRVVTHEEPDVVIITQKLDPSLSGDIQPITLDIDVGDVPVAVEI